jgi:hypothetical protein
MPEWVVFAPWERRIKAGQKSSGSILIVDCKAPRGELSDGGFCLKYTDIPLSFEAVGFKKDN